MRGLRGGSLTRAAEETDAAGSQRGSHTKQHRQRRARTAPTPPSASLHLSNTNTAKWQTGKIHSNFFGWLVVFFFFLATLKKKKKSG